jgi:EAL domain-containing protein (putative c-di-GMP-specific phosphodiesterase class I)
LPLGRWILREACQQMHLWKETCNGTCPRLSVNLSPRQAVQSGFVEYAIETVQQSQLQPSDLTFEITEHMLIDQPPITDTLRRLQAAGFKIEVDDFGTGYSSYSNLDQLPVDGLKIDRSFIEKLDVESGLKIVQLIIQHAQVIHKTVVAEGVENQTQSTQLQELGCEFAQGFLFSLPLLPEELEKYLRNSPEELTG